MGDITDTWVIPVWINIRHKQSLRTGMIQFMSSRTEITHHHKFKDRPYTLLLTLIMSFPSH